MRPIHCWISSGDHGRAKENDLVGELKVVALLCDIGGDQNLGLAGDEIFKGLLESGDLHGKFFGRAHERRLLATLRSASASIASRKIVRGRVVLRDDDSSGPFYFGRAALADGLSGRRVWRRRFVTQTGVDLLPGSLQRR